MIAFYDLNSSRIIKKERKSGCFYFILRSNGKMYSLNPHKKFTTPEGKIKYFCESEDEIDLDEFYKTHE